MRPVGRRAGRLVAARRPPKRSVLGGHLPDACCCSPWRSWSAGPTGWSRSPAPPRWYFLVTGWFSAALGIVAYLHARQAGRMRSALLVLGAAAAAGTLLVVATGATVRTWLGMLSVLVFSGMLPWLVGSYRRQRFELIRAGWMRARCWSGSRRSRLSRYGCASGPASRRRCTTRWDTRSALSPCAPAPWNSHPTWTRGTVPRPNSCGAARARLPSGCGRSSECCAWTATRCPCNRPGKPLPTWSNGSGRRGWRSPWTARATWSGCRRWRIGPRTAWCGRR